MGAVRMGTSAPNCNVDAAYRKCAKRKLFKLFHDAQIGTLASFAFFRLHCFAKDTSMEL